jgi:predicted nucleic acid-binding protein
MTVHLDTSILIETLASPRGVRPLIAATERGDRLEISSVVLYEWLRGPRSPEQRALSDAFFPAESIVRFGADEARVAAQLYGRLRRARGREADIAIAACAIENDAAVWTRNTADFADIPGLTLYRSL